MLCSWCGVDLEEINSDNLSPFLGFPLCEDCAEEQEIIDSISKKYEESQYYGGDN